MSTLTSRMCLVEIGHLNIEAVCTFREINVLIENERFCEFLILKTIVTFLELE